MSDRVLKALFVMSVLLVFPGNTWADTVTVGKTQSDGSHEILLKRIVERVGDHLLRALVVDQDGHEQQLLLTADDVYEAKRGLWVVRPGVYQTGS